MKSLLNVQHHQSAKAGCVTQRAPQPGQESLNSAPGVKRPAPKLMVKTICLFLWLTAAFAAPAQTPPARHVSGRFLFIVDTSAAMRNRSSAEQKALSTLLHSGMDGQLQPGDTIGVWTYNEQLHAGDVPLQQWTPENEQLVASNILAFLDAQKFEKQSRFNAVWPELERLVKESEKLTVLLVSAGSDNISGTPFDASINAFFKGNAKKQKQKRMPFITVLRSYRGKFTGATLNLAPWPVEFPSFPPEPTVAARPIPKPPLKKTPPPLIVIGGKPEPASVAPAAQSNSTPTEPASAPSPPIAATETATTRTTEPISPKPDASPEATPAVKPAVPPVTATPESTPTSPSVIASSTESPRAPTLPSVKPEPTAVTPSASADETKPAPAKPLPTEQQPSATPTEQVATATAPEKLLSPTRLLIIGAVFVVLAGAAFFLIRRRTQTDTRISLITRSMDQNKK